MTTTKHTPAPWKACNSQVRSDKGIICNMPYISTETEIKLLERDANERLIAAAPDLLAVVEKLLAVPANQIGDVLMLIPSARAAIAKATGKE